MRVVALWLIPLWVAAFVGQRVAVLALKSRRPKTAATIERWWPWAPLFVLVPLFVVLIGVLIWSVPLVGIPVAALALIATYGMFFSASSVGSPFRPRR